MGQITAIIFDFFGVVSIRSHEAFLEETFTNKEELAGIYNLRRQHDIGLISVEDYLEAVGRAANLSPEKVLERLHDERVINEQLATLIRTELKGKYKIGLLSNAAGDLRTFVPDGFLEELFDDVLISADYKMIKPDPRIFKLACEHLDAQPAQAVMIDDMEANCEGAKAAGLQAICYTNFNECREKLQKFLK